MYFDEYVKLAKDAQRKISIRRVSPNRKGINRILLHVLTEVQLSDYVIIVERGEASYAYNLPSKKLYADDYACVYMQQIANDRTIMNGMEIYSCCMDMPDDFIIDDYCLVRLCRIEQIDVKKFRF